MSKFSLDQFLIACGAEGPLHLTVGGSAGSYVLPQPFALVGTDPRADVRPADPRLPRRAAYLQVVDGRLLCLDLHDNAAGPPGRRPPHQWLTPGNPWTSGGLEIGVAVRPGPDRTGPPPALPHVAVDITGGVSGTCRYPLKSPVVLIGKSSRCQVRLRDSAVSRYHCALVQTPAGLWAVDLLGRGGITVNGAAARAARLDDGDDLRVGGFSLRPRRTDVTSLVARGSVTTAVQVTARPTSTVPDLPTESAAPLLALFAEMQREMAEQFRQTMTTMADSFGQMHADQMRLVREELAEIHRLSEEVASLKATQARLPPPATFRAPVSSAPPAAPDPGPAPSRHVPTAAGPRPAPPRPAPAVAAQAPAGEQVHDWLSQRVADLQRERESRWQRVVGFLTGGSPASRPGEV